MEKINHIETAKQLMLNQFKNAKDLHGLLESWITPLQDTEEALYNFIQANGVTNSTGEMLDIIGSWMGVPRETRNDIEYRQAILGKALLETMDGTTDKFYEGMVTLCNSEEVTFHENYPPTVYPQLGEGWNNATYDQVKAIKMAGMGFVMLVDHHLDSMTFSEVLSQDNNLGTPAGESYTVEVNGVIYNLITVQAASAAFDSSGDPLAELTDTTFTPMAEVVTGVSKVVEGFIADQDGNFIVDQDGNRYTYRDLT